MMNVTVKLEEKNLHEVFRKASPAFFRQAGAYLRRVAQNSIKFKRQNDDHSAPGKPPFYHGAAVGNGVNFKQSVMFSAGKESVLIGAIAGRLGALGALHEFGGSRTVEYIDSPAFGRVYQVGDIGPVATEKLKNHHGRYVDPLTGYPVAFVEIETQRMAEHATRVQNRILRGYKHFRKKKSVTYPARPFMQPAYEKAEPYLLKIWKDSL